ncbi:hypothetical protein SNEBB_010822 [Seison nebaliae]|nr:hypothetical protein SNEBB_010822 [Seison nebaliae]
MNYRSFSTSKYYKRLTNLHDYHDASEGIPAAEHARHFVLRLTEEERHALLHELKLIGKDNVVAENRPSFQQLKAVALHSGLPYIGFGFIDNFIMIIAGDAIDTHLGAMLCLSTMAAAGLGNLVSDVAGMGLTHYVETTTSKFGIEAPELDAKQWNMPITRSVSNIARALCIAFGCVIGMFPLLFIDKEKKEKNDD